jgi:hypothetical protein
MVTEGINQTNYRISLAHTFAPEDIFTKVARVLVPATQLPLMVLAPVEMVTTALGGCLAGCTFGLLFVVLSIIWWPFLAFLLGTSWLWLHAWYLRPILLLPGVIVALVADLYVMLMPEPEKDAKYMKLSMAGEWPLSWYLFKPPAE